MGRVIVVIGMHRSGTSLVTRGLGALGVQLGDNLSTDAAPDNAKGHWEDRDILELNERLMTTLALQWDVVGAADDALMAAPSLAPLVEQAGLLVEAKTAGNAAWAFKDPRTARLWPFWRRVFAEAVGAKPDFVWVIRHPLAVAQSLTRRDGFTPLKSHLLWLRHNIIPFADIAASRHVVVDYDRMLSGPRVELRRIVGALALEAENDPAIADFADSFLDSDLRHFQSGGESATSAGLEWVVARAYRALEPVARDSARLTDPDFQAEWRDICREADAFSDAASHVDISTVAARSLRQIEGRLAEAQRRAQSNHSVELQKQVTDTLQEQFAEVTRRLEDTGAGLSESQQRRHEDFAAGLQKQVAQSLREQFAEVTRRLEDTGAGLSESQQRRHEDFAAGLQKQVAQSLREQFAEVTRRLEDTGAGLSESQQRRHEDFAAGLQKQVAQSLREQFAEVTRRLEDTGAGLSESQQRRHEDFAAGLQKQVAQSLREQFTEVTRRLEDTGVRLSESQQRRHEDFAAGLQKQVAQSLREQFAETGRHIEETEARLAEHQRQSQTAGFAALQEQFTATLREQSTETGRRFEQFQSQLLNLESGLERSRADLAFANALLNRERYSVLKPLLRRAYRLGVRMTEHLPAPVEQRLRRLKRKLLPRSMAVTVTIGGTVKVAEAESDIGLLEDIDRLPGCCDILVWPVIDWHFRFQRPQQLARQLAARGHRVCYLSTTFEPAAAPGFSILESPAPNVVLVKLSLPGSHPSIYKQRLIDQQRELLSAAVHELVVKASLDNLVAIVDLPFWRPLVEAIPGCLMVYDCMDHHAGFSTNSPWMIEEETRLLKQADLVVTTSAGLSEIVGQTAKNLLIRNAGEVAYFGETPARLAYSSQRPVAGYLGAIADWFDIGLVTAAANRFPDWDFVLVGSTDYCDVAGAEKLANVKLIGEVPYDQAAAWVHSFDVAMIPFKLTELTRCTNPVKIYEYLAAGKPVVATALPEVKLMAEVAHVADTHEEFMELLDTAMAERGDDALAARRRQWAAAHDWGNRAEQLDEAIRSAFPKVSVIVLTYNNLDFTKACLGSLEANTRYPNWELLLVDNASTDGSCDFLADYAANNAHARFIPNDENLGFAAGNNRGLEAAAGEYLVVLNNDTYVTPGWLPDLVRHLRQDPGLGLVGAVTNNIGNEAKIEIHYRDMAEMQQAAYLYTSGHARAELDVDVVAFFCAAMPRLVFETVGGLDERFGLGFFEDDDYCQRVAEAGYRITIAEDVFVHHHLSASFDALNPERRQALFDRNKALYEEKWGAWTPHRYRDH